jgi:hypothetical protein
MSDIVSISSYNESPLYFYNTSFNNPGIYIEWDRITSAGVSVYTVQRSDYFDGTYEDIANVAYPINEYVDAGGRPNSYYKIIEKDSLDSILATSAPFSGDELLMKSSLRYELQSLLNVPIYDEEVIFNGNRNRASVAFPYWNFMPRPELRITGFSEDGNRDPMIVLSENDAIYKTKNGSNNYPGGLKYKTDYMGNIHFLDSSGEPTTVHPYDTILASYSIRLFTGSHMNQALYMALQSVNSQPGSSKYSSVSSAPYYYEPALIIGASYYLLRSLLTSLTQRQKRLLLEDPDAKIIDDLRNTTTMYKEEFEKLLEKLPLARLPNTRSITVPEYNMPGGRSRFFRFAFNIPGAI